MITNINQLDLTKKYTYADYLSWQFKQLPYNKAEVGNTSKKEYNNKEPS